MAIADEVREGFLEENGYSLPGLARKCGMSFVRLREPGRHMLLLILCPS